MKRLLILSSLLLALSCSYKNQTLDLKISPQEKFAKASKNSDIFVSVFDKRPNTQIIGTKHYFRQTINLTSKQHLADVLENSINKKLHENGFELNQNRRYIDLHILEMDYITKKGIFVGSSTAAVKIKAIVKNYNQTKLFEKTFNLSLNRKHAIISDLATDKQTIENLLSETIADIFQDKSIMNQISN